MCERGALARRSRTSALPHVSCFSPQPAGTCLTEQDLLAVGRDHTLVLQGIEHRRAFRASMDGCWFGVGDPQPTGRAAARFTGGVCGRGRQAAMTSTPRTGETAAASIPQVARV